VDEPEQDVCDAVGGAAELSGLCEEDEGRVSVISAESEDGK
jgi:hypothetical protein